ncbi:CopG family transcriptional regulator [Kitasatospora sp. NPDC002040]|uniref:ribbon-helix-helix domain-containing protein n=1 Tax=Kitasatospora sp. NPDC002040 TaxID=3154661 RepID=UPI00331EDB45
MALKRTTVYADSEDLAVIKAAAARRGISEAEIIREAVHLAAMANRVWDEPFFSSTYPGDGSIGAEEVWAERARAYEATRRGAE